MSFLSPYFFTTKFVTDMFRINVQEETYMCLILYVMLILVIKGAGESKVEVALQVLEEKRQNSSNTGCGIWTSALQRRH